MAAATLTVQSAMPPSMHKDVELDVFTRPLTPSSLGSNSESSPVHGLGVHDVPECSERAQFERKMGDSELSYYLPSRANGVNDMYLHLGFRVPERLILRARVRAVWAILRVRHPLLAAQVQMHDYDDVRFVYSALTSAKEALADADDNLEYRTQTKDELIDSYLNGPRTLSNSRVSYLIVSQSSSRVDGLPTPPASPLPGTTFPSAGSQARERDVDLMICAAHFLGDGMALHAFANDFFGLLGSEMSQAELEQILEKEWQERWGSVVAEDALPNSLEEYLPGAGGKLRRAAAKVDFQCNQEKQIGGHSFPRRSSKIRHTIVPTVPFDADRTKAMLKKCKANGVSISAALFAVCNIAWARMAQEKKELPTMMYTALNLRPYFPAQPPHPSYWFLAVSYFNVVLPSFLPSTQSDDQTFWHRAKLAKDQCAKAAKSKMAVERTRLMAQERGARARMWAREDDEKERIENRLPSPHVSRIASGEQEKAPVAPALPQPQPQPQPRAPSQALIGLSLLGNLDGIYKHANFPAVKLHTLTTGSRQRNGGMLLFGYTFAGKLWVSLGYDEEGFDREVVTKFWEGVLRGVDEFL